MKKVNIKKCPACNNEVDEVVNFCPYCGLNLVKYGDENLNVRYEKAVVLYTVDDFEKAYKEFSKLGDYKDSQLYIEKCKNYLYINAIKEFDDNVFLNSVKLHLTENDRIAFSKSNVVEEEEKIDINKTLSELYQSIDIDLIKNIKQKFSDLGFYRDAHLHETYCQKALELYDGRTKILKYKKACKLIESGSFKKAKNILVEIKGYKDVDNLLENVNAEIDKIQTKKQAEEKRQKEIQRKKEKIASFFRRILEIIIAIGTGILFLLPVGLSVFLGILLFSNAAEITPLWLFILCCYGWGGFSILSLVCTINLFNMRYDYLEFDEFKEAIQKTLSIIASFLPIILSVFLGILLFSNYGAITPLWLFVLCCIGWGWFSIVSIVCTVNVIRLLYESIDFDDFKEAISISFGMVIALLPIILSVIFGFILFSNSSEITLSGPFIGWCTAWGIFVILTLVYLICLLSGAEFGEIFEPVIQFLAMISPIIMSVIFGILLFANTEQLLIRGSFGGWCTGWIFFVIASIIATIVLLNFRFNEWDVDDTESRVSSLIVSLVIILLSIIVFSCSNKLTRHFDPTTFISFEVTGKSTSTGSSKYYSKVYFSLRNNSDIEVTYILGEMNLYNGNTFVASWNVYFNGNYIKGNIYTTSVEFYETNKTDLFNTSFENLRITYRITSMKFNGDLTSYDFNGKTTTIKEPTNSSYSYNPVTPSNTLLGQVQNFAGSNAILPDNYEEAYYEEENPGCQITSYYDWREYTSFYIMFTVSDEDYYTFYDEFVSKLISNGYSLRSSETGNYEYIKGNTVIHFSDVYESNVWNGAEYVKEYNYFNYYAYKIN